MPAKSIAQRRLSAIAEKHPEQLHDKNKGLANLSQQTLHDFAATSEKRLPQYKADGMTNTAWQQSEPVRSGNNRPDWMERAVSGSVPNPVPHMADGKRTAPMSMKSTAPAFRIGKTEKATADPAPRKRQYFKTAW